MPSLVDTSVLSYEPGVVDTEMQTSVRTRPASEFPWVGTFVDFKRQGMLVRASVPAAEIMQIPGKPAVAAFFGASPGRIGAEDDLAHPHLPVDRGTGGGHRGRAVGIGRIRHLQIDVVDRCSGRRRTQAFADVRKLYPDRAPLIEIVNPLTLDARINRTPNAPRKHVETLHFMLGPGGREDRPR